MAILRWVRENWIPVLILAAIGAAFCIGRNWKAVSAVIGVLVGGFFFRREDSGVSVRQRERAERAEAERVIGETEQGAADSRKKRASRLEKIRSKVIAPVIILTLLLGACTVSAGQSSNLPYIPGDYATLKTRYLELWDISEEWRALYYDAETSVTVLQESNARLQQIIKEQAAEIEQLKHPRPAFGVFGGGSYSPAGPGVFVGGSITF